MNILIVDDNKNNRMIVSLLLENYAEEKGVPSFSVKEVGNGQEAVDAVKEEKFDLIFMDIMMPVMDGITATKEIRKIDTKVMIIAVSAVDDDARKKVILANGAEDYISKPVNADIFSVRLQSYLRLIQSRCSSNKEAKTHKNLFSQNIYSRYVHFFGENEDELSQFWEYYLLNNITLDDLSDMVRFIFAVALDLHNKGENIDIYEEQSDDRLFLTLVAQKSISSEWIMDMADNNNYINEYKIEKNVLSAFLDKVNSVENVLPLSANVILEPSTKEVPITIEDEVKVALKTEVRVENRVFDILDEYDFADLEDYISRLNSLLLIMGSSELDPGELEDMLFVLNQIARTLSSYTEFYTISQAMSRLSKDIAIHKDVFIEKSHDMAALTKAFGGDLITWREKLFITGAPSINFMDDSIISNVHMISSFINGEEASNSSAEALDDIFDF